MSVQTITFRKSYNSTDQLPAPGSGNRLDSFTVIPEGPSAIISSVSLNVISSFLIDRPVLNFAPVGTIVSGASNVSAQYSAFMPGSAIEYEIIVTLAVPTSANGADEILTQGLGIHTGRIAIFEHRDFGGDYLVLDSTQSQLSVHRSGSDNWNDRISSFAVLRGNWQLFRHENFQERYVNNRTQQTFFAPGIYSWVEDYGIDNDQISSLICRS